jgi:hypothetical protein
MNDEQTPSRLLQLCSRARAHRAPPELWSAITARLAADRRRRPWTAVAAVLTGAIAYFGFAAVAARVPAATDAALTPIVAAALPGLVDRPEPLAGNLQFLQQLAVGSGRSR